MAGKKLSVMWGAQARPVGVLLFDSARRRVSQFSYDSDWLAGEALSASPDLQLLAGWQTVRQGARRSPFPMALADTEPDSWGRRVIDRAYRKGGERVGVLDALDYLLAVDDFSRVGALRLARPGESPEALPEGRRRTPTLIDLGKIYAAGRRLEAESETLEDLLYLEGKGTSLGGARPKCSVLNEAGDLCLAKFPSMADGRDIEKGEILGLRLARQAGVCAAEGEVKVMDGLSVGIVKRFDRVHGTDRRIPYWSMATFLNQQDEEEPVSYLELFEALLETSDGNWELIGTEIVKRMMLNCLMSNFDDHAHNTGLLMSNDGNWRLAPAFDLNPTPLKHPEAPYESKLYLAPEDGPVTDVRQIMGVADRFGLTKDMAKTALKEVLSALTAWKTVAQQPGVSMSPKDLRDYAPAFEHHRMAEALLLVK